MKKTILIIVLIVLFIIALGGGLMYWKVKRVTQSFMDSAKRANSHNTPLSD